MTTTNTSSSANNAPRHAQWGAYGDVTFKGLFTPSEISDSRKFKIQAQQLVNGYPSHQFFGEDERTFNLSIWVDNRLTDLTEFTRVIDEMAEGGINRLLVIGSEIKGSFAIRSMSKRQYQTLAQGQVIAFSQTFVLVEVRSR